MHKISQKEFVEGFMEETQDIQNESLVDEFTGESAPEQESEQQEFAPEEQTPDSPPVEPEVPETLKKFVRDDGQLDYEKLQQSYVEQEKTLGKRNQEFGELRKALFSQSQATQPFASQPPQQSPPVQQQPYRTREQQEEDYAKFVSQNGMWTEDDYRGLDNFLTTWMSKREQQATVQTQQQTYQQAQTRWSALQNYANATVKEMDVDPIQEQEITRLLNSNHKGYFSKLYDYAMTGQGLDESNMHQIIEDLSKDAQANVRSHFKRYGVDAEATAQVANAMKQQAAQVVSNPSGKHGSKTTDEDLLSGLPKEKQLAYKQWLDL